LIKYKQSGNFRDAITRINPNVKARLDSALPNIRTEIITRTKKGQSPEGSTFKPYSKSYADYKRKRGLQSSPPDLKLTGNMLNSIQTKVGIGKKGISGKISVTGEFNRQKARWNQGDSSRVPFRRFMAMSEEQVKRLINYIFR